MVIPLKFTFAFEFDEGLAQVLDGEWLYIDRTGKYIWQPGR
jgi:hypothetical protein